MKNKIISQTKKGFIHWIKIGDARANESYRLKAMESYEKAIENSTNDKHTVTALNKLALIQLKLMFYEDAIKTMHEALSKTTSSDLDTLNNYSEILINYAEPCNNMDNQKRSDLHKEALKKLHKIVFLIEADINVKKVAYKSQTNLPLETKAESLINNYKKALRNKIRIVFDGNHPYETMNLLKEFIFLFPQENKEWELILEFKKEYNKEEHAKWQKLHDEYLKDPKMDLKKRLNQFSNNNRITIPIEIQS